MKECFFIVIIWCLFFWSWIIEFVDFFVVCMGFFLFLYWYRFKFLGLGFLGGFGRLEEFFILEFFLFDCVVLCLGGFWGFLGLGSFGGFWELLRFIGFIFFWGFCNFCVLLKFFGFFGFWIFWGFGDFGIFGVLGGLGGFCKLFLICGEERFVFVLEVMIFKLKKRK